MALRMPRPSCVPSALAALLLLTSAVNAAEKLDCENAVSTIEMNACAEQEFDKEDALLNETYKNALAAIPEMATEHPYDAKSWEGALRASQRAWLAYRDAECDAHVPMFWSGGTGTTAEVIGCKSDLTKARTKELKDRYEAP